MVRTNGVNNINIRDHADEFRVEVALRFAGSVVEEILHLWKAVLLENNSRRFTVDISQLDGYDHAGCTLLRDMHLRGVHIVASTPHSLIFLQEISGPRKLGPALVRKSSQREQSRSKKDNNLLPFPTIRTRSRG